MMRISDVTFSQSTYVVAAGARAITERTQPGGGSEVDPSHTVTTMRPVRHPCASLPADVLLAGFDRPPNYSFCRLFYITCARGCLYTVSVYTLWKTVMRIDHAISNHNDVSISRAQ